MAITIKTKEEIEHLREGGRRLYAVLHALKDFVRPGITTKEVDVYAEKLIRDQGDTPAFLNYKPEGARFAFPASLCISVNDEVVHGIPNDFRMINEGDLVSLDLGIKHKNLFTDSAITIPVGKVTDKELELLKVAEESLMAGIAAARAGNRIGDISYAIETVIKPHGFGIIRILSGHGVGHEIHEDPYVPNYGKKGEGEKLVPGMVLALEPMITLGGDHKVVLQKDGYTYTTKDGSKAAHFEHTIAITDGDPIILTAK